MKTLDKVANQTVTADDVEKMVADNSKVSKYAWAYTQRDEKELSFHEDVAYDPRLIDSGVVYGD